jgi:hypothetical protein
MHRQAGVMLREIKRSRTAAPVARTSTEMSTGLSPDQGIVLSRRYLRVVNSWLRLP